MGARDEPSNPFKNPRKSTPDSKKSPKAGHKSGRGRGQSGPPAPPGNKPKAPPVAPAGNAPKKSEKKAAPSAPARAGKSVGLRKQSDTKQSELQRKTDERARELIEATRIKATETQSAKNKRRAKSNGSTRCWIFSWKRESFAAPAYKAGGSRQQKKVPDP